MFSLFSSKTVSSRGSWEMAVFGKGEVCVWGMLPPRAELQSEQTKVFCLPCVQLKEDIIRAVAAMMGLLLHQEEYQGHVCDQLSWLLDQYEEVQDGFHVTKVRCLARYDVAAWVRVSVCWEQGAVGVPGGAGNVLEKKPRQSHTDGGGGLILPVFSGQRTANCGGMLSCVNELLSLTSHPLVFTFSCSVSGISWKLWRKLSPLSPGKEFLSSALLCTTR